MSNDFEIPDGLSEIGRKAAKTIVDQIKKDMKRPPYGGGCKAFYTPQEWADRGEKYGLESELIVCHDGGDAEHYFSMYSEMYNEQESMRQALNKIGAWAEACTGWYTAIYK